MVHIGSWGLPDFGVTEAIQSWIKPKAALSAEGGSNLFGPASNAVIAPASTSVGGYFPQNTQTTQTNKTTSSPQSPAPTPTQEPQGQSGPSPEEIYRQQMMGQIESGYNDYFAKLNDMYSGLDTQANAQNQIAQNSYGQSISDLNANKQSSLQDLGLTEQKLQANQVKNLRDIASNIQNQYMAGNVMLGARGAGDSSAANQYSYALNRIGSKERGNVMNQTAQSQQEIENQKAKLNNIVTQETTRLDTELANMKQNISSWLAEQQNAIKGMIADGTLRKNQDIQSATQNALNQALTAYERKQNEIANAKSTLQTWAANNASNINQLKANMQAIGQFAPQMASANPISGATTVDQQGNLRSMFGYRSSDDKLLG